MYGYGDIESEPVPVTFTPLFEARWSYEDFVRMMPFGPDSEGQAYAHSKLSRVLGERLSGSYRTVQFPRWRADGLYVPDAHGLIETASGYQVATKVGGYVIPVPGEPGKWTITHWMRMWTGASELAWLNSTVAFGVGSMVDNEAQVHYYAAAPTEQPSEALAGAPGHELLGTARWEYPEYEAVRLFGDKEGVGFAASKGDVQGGVLIGTWRGWHYPTYLRNALYQLDAHVEISGPDGVIVNRHAGLCTFPANPSSDRIYDAVQYATFVADSPGLAHLNRTLAVGVGFVRAPGLVRCSYYGLTVPA
ncbi:MAG TPA: hypothetical protein VGS16_02950 [Candidatus Dormibacteraeota bacterium]|nr:hypothetical protein [Candidatus Dormibacteraeota bacterium]